MDTTKLNAIERWALRFIQRRNQTAGASSIHRWTDEEYKTIRHLEITAIVLAAFSGMTSGFLIGGLEIWLNLEYEDYATSWVSFGLYWFWFMAISIVISLIEIIFLYWVVLWRVARVASIAGLHLSGVDVDQVIAIGLSRAALDVPDPRKPFYGIDPYSRVPRWKLWTYAVLYRLKIGATSFIIRLILRRVLARAAVRVLIPLVAIVIYSIWNAIIIGWVMRASRIRAAGPVAVQEWAAMLQQRRDALDPTARLALAEAVAETIIQGAKDHPNFYLLATQMLEVLQLQPEQLDFNWPKHLAVIKAMAPDQQTLVLDTLQLVTLLDGRPRWRQKRFLRNVYIACGRELDTAVLSQRYTWFYRGQGLGEYKG